MSARKAIERKANSKDVIFALVTDGVTFEVWVLRENYSRECKGGVKKTWRYVEMGMSEENARALFARRTK